ncbi:hypothetical protein OHB12_02290 [Nocardia sp. NBC_01730]|uniref:hypothetical protein n=1 Tax=Nocardia sp. NBC_01730 TaxID=2975998 RepID=UPI002E0E8DF5|nr:hypothetical protein OHB12_02290 [Nocardia sp. NBC_01730]
MVSVDGAGTPLRDPQGRRGDNDGRAARYPGSRPVRTPAYPLLVVLVVCLVAKGVVSDDLSWYILAAVAALLGLPAVEAARGKVTPVAKGQ